MKGRIVVGRHNKELWWWRIDTLGIPAVTIKSKRPTYCSKSSATRSAEQAARHLNIQIRYVSRRY